MDEQALIAQVRRYRALDSQIAELKEEQANIQALVDEAVDSGWKLDVDGQTASKRPGNRTFDPVLSLSHLTAEEKKSAIKTAYDEKVLRALVTAKGVVDSCMVDRPDSKPVIKLS